MKKRTVAGALACLMVMGCTGAAMAAEVGSTDLKLSGEAISHVEATRMTAETLVSINDEPNYQSTDEVLRIEDLASMEVNASDVVNGTIRGETRATNSIDWDISSGVTMKATTAFSLEADETVTINCSYSPSSATVKFGLIAPDGKFYYVTGSNGSINKTLQVTTRGQYYLAIKNESSNTVSVVGYVNY